MYTKIEQTDILHKHTTWALALFLCLRILLWEKWCGLLTFITIVIVWGLRDRVGFRMLW